MMDFLPLKTRDNNRIDWICRLLINGRRRLQHLRPMNAEQQRFDRALMERSVTARRTFFVIQMSGDTAIRTLVEHINVWQTEAGKPLVNEDDVAVAIQELIDCGLLNEDRRPRMRYEIVED